MDKDDLGFVPDTQDHDDLGFVADEKSPRMMESLDKKYHGDVNEAIGDIPLVGKPLKFAKEVREDLNASTLRSLLGGLGAKTEAAGRAGIEKISGSDQDLGALYEKYKQVVGQKQKESEARSPVSTALGKGMGALAPAMTVFGGAGAMSLPAEIGASAALGGVEGAGESHSKDGQGLAKDIGMGALKGAVAVPVAKGIGKVVSNVGEKALEKLKDSSFAKQLAATAVNAAKVGEEKGQTLFGEAGDVLYGQNKGLAKNISEQIEAPISQKNAEFTKAFQTAAQEGKTVTPPFEEGMKDVEDFIVDLGVNKINPKAMPTWTPENFQKYRTGSLTPDVANQMIQELKGLDVSKSTATSTLAQTRDNVLQTLQKNTNDALGEGVLQKLNKEKQAAWQASEPLVQTGKKEAVEEGFQKSNASNLSPEARMSRTKSFFEDIIKNAGKSTMQGEARSNLKDATELMEEANKAGNLGMNVQEMQQAAQNQSYLSAAKQNISGGSLANETPKLGSIDKLVSGFVSSPYRAAEVVSGYPAVQRASKMLLEGTPESLSSIGKKLQQIPSVSHLGQALDHAASVGDKGKMNAAIFTILQNPLARKALNEDE